MKRNRKRLIVLIIFLIGLFLSLLLKNQVANYLLSKPDQPFSSINKDQISELDIISDQKSIQIKKIDRSFVVSGKQNIPTDQSRISSLLDNIIALKKGDIISTNKSKQNDFGISKQKIIIKQGGKIFSLFIGNSAGLSGNYVRINQEDEVFTASGFDTVFSPDDYRDLAVNFITDETKITSIGINYNDNITSLNKWGYDWKIGDKIAKKDRVDYFLNDLNTLRANDLLSKNTALPEIAALIIKVSEKNQEKTITFFAKDKDNYLVQSTNSIYMFQVPAPYVESLKKGEKDFTE